jgi:hypothetical protein
MEGLGEMVNSCLPERRSRVPVQNTGRTGATDIARYDKSSCRVVGDPATFIVSLEIELARMRRSGDGSCLLLAATDALVDPVSLDDLARRIAANLRSYDALCRYGANHFLILLPHVKSVDVTGVARRVRVQAAGYALTLADGGQGFVTASTGGVMLDPDIGMRDNIDRAAKAYRAARRDGGNDHRMWVPAVDTRQPALTNRIVA